MVLMLMKKSFYYNFFPSKAEEEAAEKPHQVTRILVEIRDLYPYPPKDASNPWAIRKNSTGNDIFTGKLVLSFCEMFNHIIRHWSMDMANYLVMGNRVPMEVQDFTDENNPVKYRSNNTFFEKGSQESFLVGWADLVRNRFVGPGDEIGLYWDVRSVSLHLKLFRR